MTKKIISSGLLGGIAIFVWLAISHGPLPISGDIPKPIPDDKNIHSMLKEKITEPGIYYCPDSSEQNQLLYPNFGNEPIFTVIASGRTPDKFIGQLLLELLCIFISPIIAAWMLSLTSEGIISSFCRRFTFVMCLGLFCAIYGSIFSEKPIGLIFLSSLNTLITWALAGIVIAWRMKPYNRMQA